MADLSGKTVIITGGSRGIGNACCIAFAKAGANIVFTYNKSTQEAEKLRKDIECLGIGCLAVKADIKDYQACRLVVDKAIEKFGHIDILISNAGITKDKALMMMQEEDFKDVVDTNLGGTFNINRAVITTFLKQKSGCIVNVGSVSGIVGMPRQTNYSASKAGIVGFSLSLAKEVAGYGVRVNVVCPGYIDTGMLTGLRAEVKEDILKSIPMKRIGKSDEVADLCVFLAGKTAGYITGSVIKIDGGLTA